MPIAFIIILSISTYVLLFLALRNVRAWIDFILWPEHPTIRILWILWLGFLFIIAPISYHQGDMMNWVNAITSQLHGELLPGNYVYLPLHAQLHAALLYPFTLIGFEKFTLIVYVLHAVLIAAYGFSAGLMTKLTPHNQQLAPLMTVLAPTTIFFLFFGTNHILMWALLAAALYLQEQEQPFWAGFSAFAGGYKLMLLPTSGTLLAFVFLRRGWKQALTFFAGGLTFFVLNLPYFLSDFGRLERMWGSKALLGSYTDRLEPWHLLHLLGARFPEFQRWYLENDVWFFGIAIVCLLAVFLYHRKKVNTLQGLALSYASVVLLAPEPLRLEPLIGMLWLDTIIRKDRRTQVPVILIALVYAAFWYQQAYPQILTLAPYSGLMDPNARGLVTGLVVLVALISSLTSKKRAEALLSNESRTVHVR